MEICNNTANLKRVTASLNVKTLDKIESSPSKQPVDGFDETFQIRTLKNTTFM
jgi:hypothetical protein